MAVADSTYLVIGANHRTADAAQREKLYMDTAARSAFLALLQKKNLPRAVILSTCDRVEIIVSSQEPEQDAAEIQKLLAGLAGCRPSQLMDQLFRLYDSEAIRHLFSVACALESRIIGEAQILGQLKEMVAASQQDRMIPSELVELFQAAFMLAKRVRSQTRIGEGAVSVASAAVKLARDIHGDLSAARGLIVGPGDVGEILLEQFRLSNLSNWVMTGTARRCERIARKRGCHFAPPDQLIDLLARADVVLCVSGSGRFLFGHDACRMALRQRRNRPILILDCGMPADVDPSVDDLAAIYRYCLEDIEALAERGQDDRQTAADQARRMVQEAVVDFRRQLAERNGVPALVALREHFDTIRTKLLSDYPSVDAAEATRLLVNRLLHQPSEALRRLAADGDMADFKDTITVNRVLERLYGISGDSKNKNKEAK